ncbi:hypothetical protein B7P43_G04869 [Cryptotermes secundus]|uniref:Uncharacterized protein n=1 Tax=Cryptotermes secundus TaxID=105785 RepID=A0A2J7PW78_9NEOP|nr:hypothetical protein B7P43_G04869 [Cryptotermes secundus]
MAWRKTSTTNESISPVRNLVSLLTEQSIMDDEVTPVGTRRSETEIDQQVS